MRKLNISAILLLIVLMALSAALVYADPPNPTYGDADVDGVTGEWTADAPSEEGECPYQYDELGNPDLAYLAANCGYSPSNPSDDYFNDWFAYMYQGWNQCAQTGGNCEPKDAFGDLFLRYSCQPDASLNTLYALVLVDTGITVSPDIGQAWIKVSDAGDNPWQGGTVVNDQSGDNGTPADFRYVYDGADIIGWEASFYLEEGAHGIAVHTNANLPGETGGQTVGVLEKGIPLYIADCEETAIALVSFEAAAGNAGSVNLTWETAAEIDNAGFNLYRASSPMGPYTKVNNALISAKGSPDNGFTYSFADSTGYGGFYYRLEDVDFYGVSTQHYPSFVMVAPEFLRPVFRPIAPTSHPLAR